MNRQLIIDHHQGATLGRVVGEVWGTGEGRRAEGGAGAGGEGGGTRERGGGRVASMIGESGCVITRIRQRILVLIGSIKSFLPLSRI